MGRPFHIMPKINAILQCHQVQPIVLLISTDYAHIYHSKYTCTSKNQYTIQHNTKFTTTIYYCTVASMMLQCSPQENYPVYSKMSLKNEKDPFCCC